MRVLVRATANVIGLQRGDVAEVEVGPLVDGLIEGGFLTWLNPPAPTFADYEVTEAVKQRAERASAKDAGVEAQLSEQPALPEYLSTWDQDGGYSGADES